MENSKILYVDNNQDNVLLFESLFPGFDIMAVGSVKEALTVLESIYGIRTVVVDKKMQYTGSLERIIRNHDFGQPKLRFMLSGRNDKGILKIYVDRQSILKQLENKRQMLKCC